MFNFFNSVFTQGESETTGEDDRDSSEAKDFKQGDNEKIDIEQAKGSFQCPICLESIREEEGVMRCKADHYFHQCCLKQWIKHQRHIKGGATCPLCRGSLQIHAARLRSYLKTEDVSELERSYFNRTLQSIKEKADWVYLNQDEIIAYGTFFGAFLWGLYSGWSRRSWGLSDELLYYGLKRHIRMATSIGWLLGIIGRILGDYIQLRQRRSSRIESESSNLAPEGGSGNGE
mmetsp:Transcript_3461/g.3950  ORF Transcript_3461/g.3950 Transcript_3461/m.3950 type:complete len:231 (-) Transcript_3461:624-1316(-)